MSKLFNQEFKHALWVNKEGLIIGGVVGALAAVYMQAQGVNLMFAAESPGLLNIVKSVSPDFDLGFWKMLITYVAIGMIGGYIIDAIYKPRR